MGEGKERGEVEAKSREMRRALFLYDIVIVVVIQYISSITVGVFVSLLIKGPHFAGKMEERQHNCMYFEVFLFKAAKYMRRK